MRCVPRLHPAADLGRGWSVGRLLGSPALIPEHQCCQPTVADFPLAAFDMWMKRTYPLIPFERYAGLMTPFVIAKAPRRRRRYGACLLTALRSARAMKRPPTEAASQ